MRYRVETKTIQAPPTGGSGGNPAMLQRQGNVPLDEGRPWAGDLYEVGPVTDPGESFAAFGDTAGGDIEAWLDKGDDGTLVGWVRDGEDVYRYMDPEAWAEDVDGSGMVRSDGGAATPESIDPATAGDPDELADATDEEIADVADNTDATDEADEADAEDGADEEMPSIGEQAPNAFTEEDDEATEEDDPTEALEDPTDLPEDAGAGGEDADPDNGESDFARMLSDGAMPGDDELEAETAEEPDPAAEDEPTDEDEETVTVSPDEVDADLDELATDGAPEDEEDEDEEEDEEEEKVKGSTFGKKHLTGEHNQETHGNRNGVRSAIGAMKPRASLSDGGSPKAAPRSR